MLHILLVEDTRSDAALIKRQIGKIDLDCKIEVVQNLQDLRKALQSFSPQVIISDYNLPTCTGMEVLSLVRSKSPTARFIFVTGTLRDEELAAETILNGADGFILKKHMNNLAERLEPHLKDLSHRPLIVQDAHNRIKHSEDFVKSIQDYMDDINDENITFQERIEKIRLHLDKIKNSL